MQTQTRAKLQRGVRPLWTWNRGGGGVANAPPSILAKFVAQLGSGIRAGTSQWCKRAAPSVYASIGSDSGAALEDLYPCMLGMAGNAPQVARTAQFGSTAGPGIWCFNQSNGAWLEYPIMNWENPVWAHSLPLVRCYLGTLSSPCLKQRAEICF